MTLEIGSRTWTPRGVEDLSGQILDGRYRLGRLIGVGGMGRVYRATVLPRGVQVAIKVLHPELSTKPDSRRRFAREALAVSRLEHPHCVRVLGAGDSPEGMAYLVMELLDGTVLADHVGPGRRWEPGPVCELLSQLLAGLAHAHARGIIHRDIKPENIIASFGPGGALIAKLVDFGIAKLLDADALTLTGTVLGTPSYMSPEQAAGGQADERSDLYAIGVLAYELLTGVAPFEAEDPATIMRMQIIAPPPPLPEDLPIPMRAWVMRLLAKARWERPQSAEQARAELLEMRAHDYFDSRRV